MAFSKQQLERYARHFVLPEIGVAGQRRLLEAKVLVIGAGALGSPALLYLAAAGVGTLGIADYDRVELSNLQRQIIHRADGVGQPKVRSAQRTIQELNPDVTVIPHPYRLTVDNIRDVILDYDFILDCTDGFETKFLINDACVLENKPYVHSGVVRFGGQIMTYIPGRGPCLRCLLEKVPEGGQTCSQAGVLGAATGVMGSLQAAEAVKYILNIGEPLAGRMLLFDLLDMSVQAIDVGGGPSGLRRMRRGPHDPQSTGEPRGIRGRGDLLRLKEAVRDAPGRK